MKRIDISDLIAFATVAEESSFVRAATKLEISASAVCHRIKGIEQRIGVKLLNRTTRSVAPTAAGRQMLARLRPALDEIESAVDELGSFRESPAGHVRINAHRFAAEHLIAPKLAKLRIDYPDVIVDLSVDDGLTDIVSAGFDAGVRHGQMIAKDMISVRIGADQRTVVVGSPGYFRRYPCPTSIEDLTSHRCILYREVTSGRLYPWTFFRDGQTFSINVEPGFTTNSAQLLIRAACEGVGLAYVLEDHVADEISQGRLVSILSKYSTAVDGNFLYYTSRRHVLPALRVVINALRY